MNQIESVKWPEFKRRFSIIFGVSKLGASIMMGLADFALATLYIVGYQLNPFLVGSVMSIGKMVIAASQFFFGWISDAKYTHHWGRRKPYFIILSPILAIAFFFLLLPTLIIDIHDVSGLATWFLIWIIIFNITYGVTSPYQSWMAEQFRVDKRPIAVQDQNIFGFIGTAIMAVFSMIVLTGFNEKIQVNPQVIPPEFLYSVFAFGIITVVLFYMLTFLMPTEPHFKIQPNMFKNLKIILKNKNYILVCIMQGTASIAWIQVGSLVLLYLTVVLHFESTFYIVTAACFVLGIMVFLYIWRKGMQKIGKKRSLMYMYIVGILILPFSLIGLIPMASTFLFGLLFILGLAGAMAGWFMITGVMYPDIAEDDEKITGELRAGIYIGFPSITLNLFQAVGLFLMGVILGLPQNLGYIVWGPICSVILLVSYLYSKKFIKLDFDWEKTLNIK